MKTFLPPQVLARIRLVLICLLVAAFVWFEFAVSQSLAAHFGLSVAFQPQVPQTTNVSFADLMAAAR